MKRNDHRNEYSLHLSGGPQRSLAANTRHNSISRNEEKLRNLPSLILGREHTSAKTLNYDPTPYKAIRLQ